MPNKIILKKSSVAAKVPLAADLDFGELAVNYTDGKLYYKKSDGTTIDSFAAGTSYSDASVDTHLNTSTAITGQVLGWTGSDYDWIGQLATSGGITNIAIVSALPGSPDATTLYIVTGV